MCIYTKFDNHLYQILCCTISTLGIECDHHYNMHCGFRFNKDEVMEMDFQAYLASSDKECTVRV